MSDMCLSSFSAQDDMGNHGPMFRLALWLDKFVIVLALRPVRGVPQHGHLPRFLALRPLREVPQDLMSSQLTTAFEGSTSGFNVFANDDMLWCYF